MGELLLSYALSTCPRQTTPDSNKYSLERVTYSILTSRVVLHIREHMHGHTASVYPQVASVVIAPRSRPAGKVEAIELAHLKAPPHL